MVFRKLFEAGYLEPLERKNIGLVILLVGPGLFLYSVLIFWFRPSAIEVNGARWFFMFLFLVVGFASRWNNRWTVSYYGWLSFLLLLTFSNYLVHTTYLNQFSIDYLLGTYITIFGAILMLGNRLLIVLLSATNLVHILYKVSQSELDKVTEFSIIISIVTIFIFSFIIMNGAIRYNKLLLELNRALEKRVDERTLALELRAKELSEKNKDLEEFAYVVSHDLKRPLRNIYTLSQWLLDDKENNSDKEVVYNLEMIKEQVAQMDLLVEGILNYTLQEKLGYELEEVNLNAILNRLIKVNESKNCLIEIKKPLPMLHFNESQILQVFQNLIQNAIKHNDKSLIKIEIDYEDKGGGYLFSIADNGPGIDEKFHKKIFQLFQKLNVNPEIESIGIGLALVKKIIERAGGKVWLESYKNVGTTFYFTICKPREENNLLEER